MDNTGSYTKEECEIMDKARAKKDDLVKGIVESAYGADNLMNRSKPRKQKWAMKLRDFLIESSRYSLEYAAFIKSKGLDKEFQLFHDSLDRPIKEEIKKRY